MRLARSARAALAGPLLMAAGCEAPAPPGVEAFGGDQAFFYSEPSRKLAFVDGKFPHRTRLSVLDLTTRRLSSRRLRGFTLGGPLALSRDGKAVLLEAGKITSASRNEPATRVLLLVDPETGTIEREDLLPGPAVAVGAPEWAPAPVGAWRDEDDVIRKIYTAGREQDRPEQRLDSMKAKSAVFLPRPGIAWAQDEPPGVHARSDLQGAFSWKSDLPPALHGVAPDGRLLASRWGAAFAGYRLESLDPRSGRAEARLETEGEIETALETPSALYAVAKDPSRSNPTGREWLAPRKLHVVERSGNRWSVPWTYRRGRFFGVQPDGKLWFAVTDPNRPGAYRLDPDPKRLEAAAAALDGDLSGFAGSAQFVAMRIALGAVIALAMAALFLFRR